MRFLRPSRPHTGSRMSSTWLNWRAWSTIMLAQRYLTMTRSCSSGAIWRRDTLASRVSATCGGSEFVSMPLPGSPLRRPIPTRRIPRNCIAATVKSVAASCSTRRHEKTMSVPHKMNAVGASDGHAGRHGVEGNAERTTAFT